LALKSGLAGSAKRKTAQRTKGSKKRQARADAITRTDATDSSSGPLVADGQPDDRATVLGRIWSIIERHKDGDPELSHSARLLEKGTIRVVQKLGEEAIECLIEALAGNRVALIGESADLLYHLLVVWVNAGIKPEEVWAELERRERVSLVAGQSRNTLRKLSGALVTGTTKIP